MGYIQKVVEGPDLHDLRKIHLRWYEDGSVRIIFPEGTTPIDIDTSGSGNYRRARLTIRRRQL